MIAPITSKEYKGRKQPTHVKVKQFDKLRPNSIILLEQVRTIDKSRIKGFIDMLDKSQMKEVEKALKISKSFLPAGVYVIVPVVSFKIWQSIKDQFDTWQSLMDRDYIW